MNTQEAHALIQPVLDRSVKGHCCSKGCSHCCSEPLYVDAREADYMLEELTPVEREIVRQRTVAWVKAAKPMLSHHMPDAFKWRMLNAECPFLMNGLCSVYDRRPLGCRTFFAMGNPDDCKMPAREHQKIAVFTDVQMAALMFPYWENQSMVEMDHLGCLLSERLLGGRPASGSHMLVVSQQEGQQHAPTV